MRTKGFLITLLAATLVATPTAGALTPKKLSMDMLIEGTQTLNVARAFGRTSTDPRTDSPNACVFRESARQVIAFKVHVKVRVTYAGPHRQLAIQMRRGGRWAQMFPAMGTEAMSYRVLNTPPPACGVPLSAAGSCDVTRPIPPGPGIWLADEVGIGVLTLRSPQGLVSNATRSCPARGTELAGQFWDRIAVGNGTSARVNKVEFARRRKVTTGVKARSCLESRFGTSWLIPGSARCAPQPLTGRADFAERYSGELVLSWKVTFIRLRR